MRVIAGSILVSLPMMAQAKEPNLSSEVIVDMVVSPAQIHPFVSDLSRWPTWTAWSHERDPGASWEFEGDPGTVGHSMTWDGKELGKGRLTITESGDDGIRYDLWFGRKAKESKGEPSKGSISYVASEAGTQVSWIDQMHLGFPMRFMIPKIEAMVEADFEAGLMGLKSQAEAVAAEAAAEAAAAEAAAAAAAAAEAAEAAATEAGPEASVESESQSSD